MGAIREGKPLVGRPILAADVYWGATCYTMQGDPAERYKGEKALKAEVPKGYLGEILRNTD